MKVSDLRGILTYVPRFREKTFVIAVDGAVVTDENFANLLLLDISLPDQSGFSLLEALKAADISVPAIFLTGNVDEANKVKGLNMGGDDDMGMDMGDDEGSEMQNVFG